MKRVLTIILCLLLLTIGQIRNECCYGKGISCGGKGRCNLFCCACNGGCGMDDVFFLLLFLLQNLVYITKFRFIN